MSNGHILIFWPFFSLLPDVILVTFSLSRMSGQSERWHGKHQYTNTDPSFDPIESKDFVRTTVFLQASTMFLRYGGVCHLDEHSMETSSIIYQLDIWPYVFPSTCRNHRWPFQKTLQPPFLPFSTSDPTPGICEPLLGSGRRHDFLKSTSISKFVILHPTDTCRLYLHL